MTAQERADLAVLQTDMKTAKADISEVKGDVKAILDRFDALDKKYVTRAELNVGKWIVGTLILFVGSMAGVASVLVGRLKL